LVFLKNGSFYIPFENGTSKLMPILSDHYFAPAVKKSGLPPIKLKYQLFIL
jgi:hypothetical protein